MMDAESTEAADPDGGRAEEVLLVRLVYCTSSRWVEGSRQAEV